MKKRTGELKDRAMELNQEEQKEKQEKNSEDSLRDL